MLSLKEYQETYSERSKPTLKTLKRRCQAGHIPGALKQGGRWYVCLNLEQKISTPLTQETEAHQLEDQHAPFDNDMMNFFSA